MVRSLMALVLRRGLAWLVWSDAHAKELEIVVLRHQLQVFRRHVGRPRIRWERPPLPRCGEPPPGTGDLARLPRDAPTVLRWHREVIRRKWSRCAGRRPGRSLAEATRATRFL
jgi:putative transposase